ncbi:MAG: ribonuclease HII [Clostridiales bacterium]|jgi:ribonuclease HII|nr:ribonuclease HII [Clostridiales bacterium]MDR2750628.1 ribonuclease HII [Clostridiales bacterium]
MRIANKDAELARLESMRAFERKLEAEGFSFIAGIDEVGRGPLAGPVYACAVILPKDCAIMGVKDSKKLSEKNREELSAIIKEKAVAWNIGTADEKEIDSINILKATMRAMKDAVNGLSVKADSLLVDALSLPEIPLRQLAIIGGDGLSISIAAASIVAKVARDALMREYDLTYPEYGFAAHKGYGTKQHIDAIGKHGLCPIHRVSFAAKFAEAQDTH